MLTQNERAMLEELFGKLPIPPDYPSQQHLELHNLAHDHFKLQDTPEGIRSEFRASMNSMAYRFTSCSESGQSFCESIERDGGGPAQPERYKQERDFFVFVMSGMACVEALNYELFALGAAIHPKQFPFATDKDRKIGWPSTRNAYAAVQNTRLVEVVEAIKTKEFNDWTTLRRILFHRGLPGRKLLTSGTSSYQAFEDLRDFKIEKVSIEHLLDWLTTVLTNGLGASVEILRGELG